MSRDPPSARRGTTWGRREQPGCRPGRSSGSSWTAPREARLGLASARILSIHAGELLNTATVREPVVRLIREVGAETVLSCDPTATFFDLPAVAPGPPRTVYNHSDHRTAGWIALDSVYP